MNNRIIAAVAILAVGAMVVAGIGYATFTGTLTSNNNQLTPEYVALDITTNGTTEKDKVILDTESIVFKTETALTTGHPVTWTVVNPSTDPSTVATETSPYVFATTHLNLDVENLKAGTTVTTTMAVSSMPSLTAIHIVYKIGEGEWTALANTEGSPITVGSAATADADYTIQFAAYGTATDSEGTTHADITALNGTVSGTKVTVSFTATATPATPSP